MTDNKTNNNEPIIGIDLGTTNSLVAYCDEKGPRIIASPTGQPSLPSVVRFDKTGGQPEAVGEEAQKHAVEFPEHTIHSAKRLMGRGIDTVNDELDYLPYQVVAGERNTARIAVAKRIYTPQEISAYILQELKSWATAHFGHDIRKAVITVPAYFDDAQRQATRDAGRIAGLEVVRIVNEPTAAALAYDLDRNKDMTIAVYDLGGGTFDVSILKLQAGVFQVLSTAGDTHLGGDDIDRGIVELIQSEIRQQFSQSLTFPPSTRQAFRHFAEATKVRLSSENEAQIEIEIGDNQTYQRTIKRDELEAIITPLAQRTIDSCQRALRDAKLKPNQIDQVVMVGGSTRIPLVQKMVGNYFQTEPYTALNPDQVVALGASVQASILAGINREALLLDVIPLSLGIETMGGAVAKLIMRNTTIPAVAVEKFSTYIDGQTNVAINVYQGERELTEDCRLLGAFDLKNIPPMPAGLPKLEVTFMVDANGILTVEAIERRSEKRATIQIVPNHGLTRNEVERMELESYEHAIADMTAHRLIDLRNQSKLDMRQIQKQLDKVSKTIDANYRNKIEQKVAIVQKFIDEDQPDLNEFQQALTDMDHTTIKLAELTIAQTLQEEDIDSPLNTNSDS